MYISNGLISSIHHRHDPERTVLCGSTWGIDDEANFYSIQRSFVSAFTIHGIQTYSSFSNECFEALHLNCSAMFPSVGGFDLRGVHLTLIVDPLLKGEDSQWAIYCGQPCIGLVARNHRGKKFRSMGIFKGSFCWLHNVHFKQASIFGPFSLATSRHFKGC